MVSVFYKRVIAVLTVLFCLSGLMELKANPVDMRTAREAGMKFLNVNAKTRVRSADDLQLVTTYRIERGVAAFHVFNTPNGFVIVSADDCATPILGYSDEGPFDPNNVPIQMEEYLQGFVEQIQYGIDNRILADETVASQWEKVLATGRLNDNRDSNAVEPLLTAQWAQGCNYNALCPENPQGFCGHALVGCVAVAMGQIMHYWGYPEIGCESHSYTPAGYPTQSINYYETTYDWSNMPNQLNASSTNAQIEAVATLLWHCGVGVDMMYGAFGSGAYSNKVPYALMHYFNYDNELYGQFKEDNETWIAQIKSCLDLGRPLYYSGASEYGGNGHAFVCDGYDANDMLHFNWGWSGSGNNYFAVGAMNVNYYDFNYYNYAIFNIHPHEGNETYSIQTESNPAEGGTLLGAGTYHYGATATLTAIPDENYLFVDWTKDGIHITSNPICHVPIRGDAVYVANFKRTNYYESIICEGDTTSEHLPLTMSNRYSYSQQIYLADSIAANGPVTDIGFYYTGTTNEVVNLSLSIYLKHTSKASFTSETDWESLRVSDLYFSGTLSIDGTTGWKQIALNRPFNYNGIDNLLVCVDNNTGTINDDCYWITTPTPDNKSLVIWGNGVNYNPMSPLAGTMESQVNQLSLTFQVTQETDLIVTPSVINLGYRPSGCWMRPLDVDFYNNGKTTFINEIISTDQFIDLDLGDLEFPLVSEYHNHFGLKIGTGIGEGTVNASMLFNYGNNLTKQIEMTATAYTPAAADVWENAPVLSSFPFFYEYNNPFYPLYDNYRLPYPEIPDGPDVVYKIVLEEAAYLDASVTSGENGKVALYTENFYGIEGPEIDNNFDSNNPSSDWLYYSTNGSTTSVGDPADNDYYWGIRFPASKLQTYVQHRLTKVAIYEFPWNSRSVTINIYLGGDSIPETLALSQDYMPEASFAYQEVTLDKEITIDGTKSLWITFHQTGEGAPASVGSYTNDPNGRLESSDGVFWYAQSTYSWAIKGFVTNAVENQQGLLSEQHDIEQMYLSPGTYYLTASSTSDNWSIAVDAISANCPVTAGDPFPMDSAIHVAYDSTLLSWTLGEGTTEFKLMFGKTPNCERVLVNWSDNLSDSYLFDELLDWNTTYYWKVCERNGTCITGTEGPVWSFTTEAANDAPRNISVEIYPSGGIVDGVGSYTDGMTCTLSAIPSSGFVFKRWTEDGTTLSTNQSYSFEVRGDKHLIAVFASTGNIPFVDANVKSRCVSRWDSNHDGELSYSEAADVTDLGVLFANKNFAVFNELEYFTGLTGIPNRAFYSCMSMTSITIPRFVATIGEMAFYNCYALVSINVDEDNLFYDSRNNCNAIIKSSNNQLVVGCQNTVIPNTIASIGYNAFGGCPRLFSINLPNSLITIESNAFDHCLNLTSITLPNSLTTLGSGAFSNCIGLTSVVIPSSVVQIIDNPFIGCTNLSHIEVSPDNPRYDSRYDCNAVIETSTNKLIFGCYETVIPNDVTFLGDKAFSNYNHLTSITIPSSVTGFGNRVFADCNVLSSIYMQAETPPAMGEAPFQAVDTSQLTVFIPCNTTSAYQSAPVWCNLPIYQELYPFTLSVTSSNPLMGSVSIIQEPSCTTEAIIRAIANGGYAFVNWTENSNIVSTDAEYHFDLDSNKDLVGNFVASGNWGNNIGFADPYVKTICVAYWDTDGDHELSFDEAAAVTDIGMVFFHKDILSFDELKYFTGLTEIPSMAFAECSYLSSITFPSTITTIGTIVFSQSYNINAITVLATTPPIVYNSTFNNVPTNVSLNVPCTSLEAYQNTFGWNAFTNYQEFFPYVLSVESHDPDIGSVSVFQEPDCGTDAIIQAVANEGCGFLYWKINDEIVSIDPVYSFSLTENRHYVAYFSPEGYSAFEITAMTNPTVGGTVTGTGVYVQGMTCTLTAVPYDEYSFVQWREGNEVISTDNILTFQVTESRNLEAVFLYTLDTPGMLNGLFSTSYSTKVHFSQGNLQYLGAMSTPYWKFADYQWDYIGNSTQQQNNYQNCNRDLFGWGTSGYNHGAIAYQPWERSTTNSDYYAYGDPSYCLYDQTGQADWGYNAISNGGNKENNGWRTLTAEEWEYIFNTRNASTINGTENARFAKAMVNNVNGVILFPDNYVHPDGITQPENINNTSANYTANEYLGVDWTAMESLGCVFLPAAGGVNSWYSFPGVGTEGNYWSSTCRNANQAFYLSFISTTLETNNFFNRSRGYSVRLVRTTYADTTTYTIEAMPCPEEFGMTTGAGIYRVGETCTLTAIPNEGYRFVNWTQNGVIVSNSATYSFMVTEDGNYVANFELITYRVTAIATPEEGGIVTGSGVFLPGTTVVLTATANEGYAFLYWTKNNEVVTNELTYSFVVAEHVTYIARFIPLEGKLSGVFSVGSSTQVRFSMGNLQYKASTNTWRFAENQWDIIGTSNTNVSEYYDGWIDLFGWGTSGYNHGANNYQPWSTTGSCSDYYAYGSSTYSLNQQTGQADWGYNAISNGGNAEGLWYTMGRYEWLYLFKNRNTVSGVRWAVGNVNGINGTILLPDDWDTSYYLLNDANGGNYSSNVITAEDWYIYLESHGAVFMPSTGRSYAASVYISSDNSYWTSSCGFSDDSYIMEMSEGKVYSTCRLVRYGVRLVQPIRSYDINALPNPIEGGTVTSAGTFIHGTTATLTATPNEGYHFVNWTKDGVTVSTNPTYSFTVTGDASFVANFELNTYAVDVATYPLAGGTAIGAGTYEHGATAVLTAVANDGYSFMNWTENGALLSTSATYQFTVTDDQSLVANFVAEDGYHWSADAYQYADNMSVAGIIQIEGVEQYTSALELGAFNGDDCRGRERLAYSPLINRYILFMTIYGEQGDEIAFRLYDHQTNEEVELPCATVLSFVTNEVLGTLFEPYVFNFTNPTVDQVNSLGVGWNWYSTYIELSDIDGLAMLEEQLGDNAESINSQTRFTMYYGGYGWYGSLTSINNEQMYRLKMVSPTEITMTGMLADPAAHPITIGKGWNHIGYVSLEPMAVDDAFAGLESSPNDIVKNQFCYAQYYEGYGWYGSLTMNGIVNPGEGLMYKSVADQSKTFTYPSNPTRSSLTPVATDAKHWTNDAHAHPSNMTLLTVVELDGVKINSDDYEIAAFADDGCRGSVKLMYVEPIDRHVAFLTVAGDEAKELHFALYNTTTGESFLDAEERMIFESDAALGTFEDPFVLHFRQATGVDEATVNALVYPNPTDGGVTVEACGMRHITVTNAIGQVVMDADINGDVFHFDMGDCRSGIYMLRVNTTNGMVVKKVSVTKN